MRRLLRQQRCCIVATTPTVVYASSSSRLYCTQSSSDSTSSSSGTDGAGVLIHRIHPDRIKLPDQAAFGPWESDPAPAPEFQEQELLRQRLIVEHFLNNQRKNHEAKNQQWGNFRARQEKFLQEKLAKLRGDFSPKREIVGQIGQSKIPSVFSMSNEGGGGGPAPMPQAPKATGPPRVVTAARRRRNVDTD